MDFQPLSPTVALREAILKTRSISMASRLLSGAGRPSLLPHDLTPAYEASAISHGLSCTGDLVVACVQDPEVPLTGWEPASGLRVRLDVIKESPEWEVRITSCALHVLGTLEWLPDDVLPGYLLIAGLHPRVAELASSPGGRLGIITVERLLLHDSSGAATISFEGLAASATAFGRAFPDPDQEWTARDLVGARAPEDLRALFDAAVEGWSAAIPLAVREDRTCPALEGRLFCVDVDRTSITLMEVSQGTSMAVAFAFENPADTMEEFAVQFDRLLASCRSRAHLPGD